MAHGNIVELHCRQIRFEFPGFGIIPGLVHAAVGAQQPVLGVIGINPDRMIVAVMIHFIYFVEGFAAVERLAQFHAHHENAIDILGIGHNPGVVHRALIEFVASLPGRALIARTKNAALAIRRFNRGVNHVRINRRNRKPNAPHIFFRQTVLELAPARARVRGLVDRTLRPAINQSEDVAPPLVSRRINNVGIRRIQ